jgi:hypothetical protein
MNKIYTFKVELPVKFYSISDETKKALYNEVYKYGICLSKKLIKENKILCTVIDLDFYVTLINGEDYLTIATYLNYNSDIQREIEENPSAINIVYYNNGSYTNIINRLDKKNVEVTQNVMRIIEPFDFDNYII